MVSWDKFKPGRLKEGLVDEAGNLKPGLVTDSYSGGDPAGPEDLKPSIVNDDGTLKEGLCFGGDLKPSLLNAEALTGTTSTSGTTTTAESLVSSCGCNLPQTLSLYDRDDDSFVTFLTWNESAGQWEGGDWQFKCRANGTEWRAIQVSSTKTLDKTVAGCTGTIFSGGAAVGWPGFDSGIDVIVE